MQLGYLVVFLPLLGSILSGFFGKFIGVRNSEVVSSFFVSISAILSCIIFYDVIVNSYSNNILLFTWISSGSSNASWSIYIDSLSSLMFVVITIVSSLVHIYSIGYNFLKYIKIQGL